MPFIEKYYKITKESFVYIIALVLDPNLKWKYIKANWKKQWVKQAQTIIDNF